MAEQSMIETIARAILQAEGGCEYATDEWRKIVMNRGTVANHRVDWVFDAARAVLSDMLEAGPTQRMLDVVCSDMPGASMLARDDVVQDVFRAMLSAALEENADG